MTDNTRIQVQVEMENAEDRSVNIGGTHSLGLQELYKAAFSQEYVKMESDDYVRVGGEEGYLQLVYSGTANGIPTNDPPISHNTVFEANDTNAVLDLDKNTIQVQVIKVPHDEYQTYATTCDPHLLQRYLHDASLIKSQASNSVADAGSESLIYLQKPPLYDVENDVGIQPDKVGIKYEDCDFNSSDSFASTESIIPKTIQCAKCPKRFMFKSDLAKHEKYKHSSKQKQMCTHCNKEFPSHQNLVFHEKSHKKQQLVSNSCAMCKRSFKKSGFLAKHMMQKHLCVNDLQCVNCSQSFANENLLAAHSRKCHLITFPCEHCDQTFSKKQGLASHMKKHVEDPVRNLICHFCGKAFIKSSSLKNHLKTHVDVNASVDRSIKVELVTSDVKKETVQNEKAFQCGLCFKGFAHKPSYTAHMRKHNDNQFFICNICKSYFVSNTELTRHFKTHSLTDGSLKCITCSLEFNTKGGLTSHMKKAHSSVSTQETYTQTTEDIGSLNNTNSIVGNSTINEQDSIILTSIGSFNSVPFIITHPSPTASYTIATSIGS